MKQQRPEVLEDRAAGELRMSTIRRDWNQNRHQCHEEGFEFDSYAAWRKYEAARSDIPFVDDEQASGSTPGTQTRGSSTHSEQSSSGRRLRPEVVADQDAGELRTSTIDRDWKQNQSRYEAEGFTAETYSAWRSHEAAKAGIPIIDDGCYVPPAPKVTPAAAAPAVSGIAVTTPSAAPIAKTSDTILQKAITAATKSAVPQPAESPSAPGSAMTTSLGWATGPNAEEFKVLLYACEGDHSRVFADVVKGSYGTGEALVARTPDAVPRNQIETELNRIASLKGVKWSPHNCMAPIRTRERHQELLNSGRVR